MYIKTKVPLEVIRPHLHIFGSSILPPFRSDGDGTPIYWALLCLQINERNVLVSEWERAQPLQLR
jgi:hypothetical protein